MSEKEKLDHCIDNEGIFHDPKYKPVNEFYEILEDEVDLDASNKIQCLQDIHYLNELFNIKPTFLDPTRDF